MLVAEDCEFDMELVDGSRIDAMKTQTLCENKLLRALHDGLAIPG